MITEETTNVCLTEKDITIDLLYKGEFIGKIQSISIEKECINAHRIIFDRIAAQDYFNIQSCAPDITHLPFTIIVRTPEKFICAIKNAIAFPKSYSYLAADYIIMEQIIFHYGELEYNPRKICKRYLNKVNL